MKTLSVRVRVRVRVRAKLCHLKILCMLYLLCTISMADEGSDYGASAPLPCSSDDLLISQGPTPPLPSGIPTYTVQILNVCISGCTIASIHVSCGWFSSARLVNPTTFRRLSYNDCLVNNGDALEAGESLSFQYANSFHYPLSVSSLNCY